MYLDYRFPVAYKPADRIRIARIEFCDAVPEDPNTLVDVRGVYTDAGIDHVYFASGVVDAANDIVYATNLLCSVTLQNRVRFYNTYDISWTIYYFPPGVTTGTPVPAGSTKNKVYVSVADPLSQPTYLWESMLEVSCGAADGKLSTDIAGIGMSIQNEFFDLDVRRKMTGGFNEPDGVALVYWGPNATQQGGLGQYGEMLRRGWGKCGQWSQSYAACLQVQGLMAARAGLSPRSPENRLVVRDFSIIAQTSPIPGYPYYWSDFVSNNGIPAQSNPTPTPDQKWFANHCVVVTGTNAVLDPSYGIVGADWNSYENVVLFALGATIIPYAEMGYREQDSTKLDLTTVGVFY